MPEVRITPLMARIMDSLLTKREMISLKDLASDITEARNGLAVVGSQLGAPMNILRRLKWARRFKKTTGEKVVGPQTFPIIERFYSITPKGIRAWKEVGPRIDPVKGAVLDMKEVANLAEPHEHTWIEHFNSEAPNPAEPDMRLCTSCGKREVLQEIPERPPKHGPEAFKPTGEKLFGKHTIITDGVPYMTRYWFGRLRLHIFYRGDADDPHDHPWDFKTFPFMPYVEDVFYEVGTNDGEPPILRRQRRVVPAWQWSFRKAEFRHVVLGRYSGHVSKRYHFGNTATIDAPYPEQANTMALQGWEATVESGKVITIVWRGRERREWGFWLNRLGTSCFQAWKDVKKHGFKTICD